MNRSNIDYVFQLQQTAKNQCAMCPRAGMRNVEVVAAWFGFKAFFAGGAGTAIGGYPMAKLCVLAHKRATGFFGVVPLVMTLAFAQLHPKLISSYVPAKLPPLIPSH